MSGDPKLKSRENRSRARLRVVTEKGDLYAASSADGLWIKIGFSTQLDSRLKALGLDFPGNGPFTLIGKTISTYRVETQLHRAMQPFHQIHIGAGKELYPACPAVRLIVGRLIVAREFLEPIQLDDLLHFRRWCRVQARLEKNSAVAHIAHAPRFRAMDEARLRNFERAARRVEARRLAAAAVMGTA